MKQIKVALASYKNICSRGEVKECLALVLHFHSHFHFVYVVFDAQLHAGK